MHCSFLFNLLALVSLLIINKVANSEYTCKTLEKNHVCHSFGLKSAIPSTFTKSELSPLLAFKGTCPAPLDIDEFTAMSCYISAFPCYNKDVEIPQGPDLATFTKFVQTGLFKNLAIQEKDPNVRALCKHTCESVINQMKECKKIFTFQNPNAIALCTNLPKEKCIDGAAIKASFSAKRAILNPISYISLAFCLIFWVIV